MHSNGGRSTAIKSVRGFLVAGTCFAALLGGQAWAADAAGADADAGTVAGSGSGATNVDALIVTAERSQGAAAAPTKASLDETQPESIVSHKFIEAFTPENGDYTSVLLIAPSVGGISSNGGGIGDTNKNTLRGFQDGQFNITYDGIAFGDTNNPTHHPADYFPASNIGSAVVDRGPGEAGDLGQANYGGAIHLFSPTLSDTFNVDQKGAFGTWNTFESVTAIQTGQIAQTGGTKALFVFDYRGSDSELTGTSGLAYNSTLKVEQPIGPKATVTLFAATEYTRFFQSDADLGETWQQVLLYGKDFSLSRAPASGEFWDNYNWEKKHTDFEYVKFNYDFDQGITLEDQAYTYFYSNETVSVDDNSGILGGPNTSSPKDKLYNPDDIGGYNKNNRYRVYGNIVRLNKDWSFGTLKIGGLFEGSDTDRHNILFDLTTGLPDLDAKFVPTDKALPVADSNIKTLETSSWSQYQLFADFVLKPTSNLTITPGFKYVNFNRTIGGTGDTFPGVAPLPCSIENSVQGTETRECVSGTNNYQKPLYFGTINYKIFPNWAVYAQYATGFLIPALSALYVDSITQNNLAPTTTVNYQAGTVYNKGPFTFDADIYKILVNDLEIASPNGQFFINAGNAAYSGVEGEAAYLFPYGITLFANGSVNTAKNTSTDQTELDAPKWTDAAGILYTYHRAQASFSWKEIGSEVEYYNGPLPATAPDGAKLAPFQARQIGSYNTLNASVAYDFGHFKVKLAAFNLADHRAITNIAEASSTGPGAGDFYTFQAGRDILLTLEAKFR
jgi:iron complex outermembrane receptor protein